MSESSLAAALGRELARELADALGRVEHAFGQLSDEQVWWRPRADLNSAGNLVLHLTGNVRQLIVAALTGAADGRNRQAEFDARGPMPKAELLAGLRAVVDDATATLTAQTDANWLRPRPVRGAEETALHCAVRSVAHFRGHTQEILHLARVILGDAYRFAGPPPSGH